jgi:hypothetical protein
MWGWIVKGMPALSPRRAIRAWKLLRRYWCPALGHEHVRPRGLLTLQTAQCPQLITLQRMYAQRPALAPVDMEPARRQLDLVPLKIADLGRPQAVPIGDQDHGGVAVPVPAAFPRRCHQALDLGPGQILTCPFNCGIYDGWRRLAACL